MKKIRYNEMKEIIQKMNNKSLLIKTTGMIKQKLKIEKSKIVMKKNRLIVIDAGIEKINIGIDWVSNFYTNEVYTSIKLELDEKRRNFNTYHKQLEYEVTPHTLLF